MRVCNENMKIRIFFLRFWKEILLVLFGVLGSSISQNISNTILQNI
jgi:uncharacterized membrane protein